MTAHPIPDAALDDRQAFVGTAGSGKTYNAGSAVERLLKKGARAIIVDPLGVWWGLRLLANGKTASPFTVVIFGGAHGDIAINEHSGAVIGEAVAGMAESCILDLSQLGTKAAERRFMLAFLTALYRKTSGEPVHLVIDEADMFAPQRLLDKEGEAAKLLGMMETIVRRGRVKGFIPWLITQRPAVLSKDVLSQADGIVAFKLTASQDRAAIGAWIEGQADQQEGKAILASLPSMQMGQGVVWVPGRGILKTADFPAKITFDSSRTPKRGETVRATELKPLDVGALKSRLASVEADAKANDPRVLKARIAELERGKPSPSSADPRAIEIARKEGQEVGYLEGIAAGRQHIVGVIRDLRSDVERHFAEAQRLADKAFDERGGKPPANGGTILAKSYSRLGEVPSEQTRPPAAAELVVPLKRTPPPSHDSAIPKSEQKIIDAIRWWNVMGVPAPSHAQAAFIAGYSHKGGTWSTYLSRLRSGGLIEARGDLVLTHAGRAQANEPSAPPTARHLRETVLSQISAPLAKILRPLLEVHPHSMTHDEASTAAGYSRAGGTWSTYLSRLRSLDLISSGGDLRAQDWLFP